jgi:hypothetical protein
MIAVGFRCWGLHPKSEIPGQPTSDNRKLSIEWIAHL